MNHTLSKTILSLFDALFYLLKHIGLQIDYVKNISKFIKLQFTNRRGLNLNLAVNRVIS